MRRSLFVSCVALAASLLSVQSQAAVVYSGTVNIPLTPTFDGTYLNMVTGAVQQGGGTGPAGWDINPWVTGGTSWRLFASSNGAAADGGFATTASTTPQLFTSGQTIDSSLTWSTSASIAPPLGENVYGVRLLAEGSSTIHYGWVRINFATGPLSGSIVDYAYESTAGAPILALAGVPEPTTLTAVAALGTLVARRRRA